jgi:adenylate cyclase class IV
MAEELKVRVLDWRAAEAQLLANGATFREERKIVDTYFNQPVKHEVLKIQEDGRGHWLVHLTPHEGKFKIVTFDPIADPAAKHVELTERFGIMSVLRKRCRFYDWGTYFLDFNLIEEFGDFLVITGDAPTEQMLRDLRIDIAERITVPFNELPRHPTSNS